jgi:uncharacterized protein
MNKVIHFEIPFDEKARAKKFYSETFGWEFDEMPEINYTGITTTPTDENSMPLQPGAINGGLTERGTDVPTPVITIEVDSIDDHLKKIEAAGGKQISPKGEVPNMGYYAYVKDTEGNVIGLWENI